MHSQLERTIAAVSRRVGAFLASLLCLASLCAALQASGTPHAHMVSRLAPVPSGDLTNWALSRAEMARAVVADCGEEERQDQFTLESDDELALPGPTEPEEEEQHGDAPPRPGAAWFASARGTLLHRADPIVGLCCPVVAPTRGPPACARTVVRGR